MAHKTSHRHHTDTTQTQMHGAACGSHTKENSTCPASSPYGLPPWYTSVLKAREERSCSDSIPSPRQCSLFEHHREKAERERVCVCVCLCVCVCVFVLRRCMHGVRERDHKHRRTHRHTHTHTDRQTQTDRHTHTHTDRQTHTHTQTDTHTHTAQQKKVKSNTGLTLGRAATYRE